MISREKALEILDKNLKNKNLFRHCLAVEEAMRALARKLKIKNKRLKIEEDKWALVGLLHDGDWEVTHDDPSQHTKLMIEWLRQAGEDDEEILHAISTHNFAHQGENKPETLMEWALFTCDELTGLIVATTLVMPDKKLSSVKAKSVLKKFPSKSFAAGVRRDQIKMCQEKLGIKLPDFIEIVLKSMQGIAGQLGL